MSSERASGSGAHLAEMDCLLRDIQVELMPGHEPAPALDDERAPAVDDEPARAVDDEPAPTARAGDPPRSTFGADPRLQELSELSVHLLASTRELLAGYERVLVCPPPSPPPRRPARRWLDAADVTVAAGPFRSLEALRAFERAVARLPGVRAVVVRGYEGTDRAIIEVRLENP